MRILCVIPARGGSKGLPGKNILPIAGEPLIGHTIKCAECIPEISRTIISTDAVEIATVARSLGADVPFERPSDLATDAAPMAGVLRHALSTVEEQEGTTYDAVVLMDPTSPGRDPKTVQAAIEQLAHAETVVDGVVAISKPFFHPVWVGVREDNQGILRRYFDQGRGVTRRQDNNESYFRINGSFYVWRSSFVRSMPDNWVDDGNFLGYETPEIRSFAIDYEDEFTLAKTLIESGVIRLPWISYD